MKAKPCDLPELLTLQRLAYLSEARLVNDLAIAPLKETLEEIAGELREGMILKAIEDGSSKEILGSVRGRLLEGTLYIGRLMVAPKFQNRGIGTRLLSYMEALYPGARYELFTSDRSIKNLSLYTKNGYREFKREPLNGQVSFIFLEK